MDTNQVVESRVCEICGNPLAINNVIGICTQNNVCKSENTRKRKAGYLGYEYIPLDRRVRKECAGCGKPLHNKSQNRFCRVNPDCQKDFLRDQYSRNKVSNFNRHSYHAAKRRAKIDGRPFNITLEDLPPIPDVCPALGIPITILNNRTLANSVSLDCIIPEKGYVKGNIQWLSYRANSMKRDASREELEAFAKWILTN